MCSSPDRVVVIIMMMEGAAGPGWSLEMSEAKSCDCEHVRS